MSKFCKFLKKAVTFFGKTPCVKNPKRFSFWYHWSTLTLFYLIRFLVGASFEGSGSGFVFAEVAKIVKKPSKKGQKTPKNMPKKCGFLS